MTPISKHVSSQSLRISICLPELHLLQRVMKGEIADATFIIQEYIAKGLKERGHQLKFLGLSNSQVATLSSELDTLMPARRTWTNSHLFEIVSKMTWRIQRFLGFPYLNMFSNLRLIDACMQCLPGSDLVYERNGMYGFGVALVCKWLGIPYVLYVEADDILEHEIMKKPITGLLRSQAAAAFRYNLYVAHQVICVSEPLKAHLIKKWKVPSEKIVVFSNVADVKRFKPDPDAREKVRASFDIRDAPLVIFVGNFYVWHDVATLLQSFVRVLNSHPDACLMLVGDGAKRNAMAQLATELGIDRSVIFTGMVAHADVPRLMASADIAVVPYPTLEQDVWLSPLKLFEYMATGNAIIASNVGQLPEWISDGWNGLLIPPSDVLAMAVGIEQLIDDSRLRKQLGQNARNVAMQKHSWDRYISDLEGLYFSILTRGKHN